MILLLQGYSVRAIARTLRRLPSTITRKLQRALQWPQHAAFVPPGSGCAYDAQAAGARACAMRLKRCHRLKRREDGVLFRVVHHVLLEG